MKLKTVFGSDYSVGKNLQVFLNGRDWFKSERKIDTQMYYVNVDVDKRRFLTSFNRKPLPRCKICGATLYRLGTSTSVYTGLSEDDEDDNVYVNQMKHLMFLDSQGNRHLTCYRQKSCLDRFYKGSNIVYQAFEISFDVFKRDFGIVFKEETPFSVSMEKDFYLYLKPFVDCWSLKEISKSCFKSFLVDLRSLRRKFVDLYFDDRDKDIVVDKILKYVGVHSG